MCTFVGGGDQPALCLESGLHVSHCTRSPWAASPCCRAMPAGPRWRLCRPQCEHRSGHIATTQEVLLTGEDAPGTGPPRARRASERSGVRGGVRGSEGGCSVTSRTVWPERGRQAGPGHRDELCSR